MLKVGSDGSRVFLRNNDLLTIVSKNPSGNFDFMNPNKTSNQYFTRHDICGDTRYGRQDCDDFADR